MTENSTGIGTVTLAMVQERAVELAAIDARSAHEVSKSDWEQAKRELTGEPDTDSNGTALDSAFDFQGWDPVPGSTGQKVPVTPSDDEDDEGRSDSERLVEEGVREAVHDQMLQAARAQAQKDES